MTWANQNTAFSASARVLYLDSLVLCDVLDCCASCTGTVSGGAKQRQSSYVEVRSNCLAHMYPGRASHRAAGIRAGATDMDAILSAQAIELRFRIGGVAPIEIGLTCDQHRVVQVPPWEQEGFLEISRCQQPGPDAVLGVGDQIQDRLPDLRFHLRPLGTRTIQCKEIEEHGEPIERLTQSHLAHGCAFAIDLRVARMIDRALRHIRRRTAFRSRKETSLRTGT